MIACYMGEVMSEHRKGPTSLRIAVNLCEAEGDGEDALFAGADRGSIARAISPEAAVMVAREVAVWGTGS
jgi:kynureninase